MDPRSLLVFESILIFFVGGRVGVKVLLGGTKPLCRRSVVSNQPLSRFKPPVPVPSFGKCPGPVV